MATEKENELIKKMEKERRKWKRMRLKRQRDGAEVEKNMGKGGKDGRGGEG